MMRPAQTSAAEARYRGVRKRSWGKWVCEIRLPNSRERIWLGSYDSAEKAAHAFDAAMYCLRGRRGRFNFPDDIPNIPGGCTFTPQEIRTAAMNFANNVSASTSQKPTAKLQVDGNDMSATTSPTFSASEVSSDEAMTEGDIDWSSFSDWLPPQTPKFSGGFASIDEFQTEFLPPSDNLNTDFGDDNGGDVVVFDSQHSSLWSF